MASDADDFDQNIENLKTTVRQSFAHVYASLKARELKTLRQLDALRKQCQDDKDLKSNCVQNIQIRYDNESTLLDHDYVSPNDDHMYSYKTIEELTKADDNKELEAIEEAAMKQITKAEHCVCKVSIRTEDVARKFRDLSSTSPVKTCDPSINSQPVDNIPSADNITEDEKSDSSDPELKKIDPTDEWLNSIKNQTEIEPAVADVMEHSTITCS